MLLFDLTVHIILIPVSLFILLHVISSSAAIIITMATRDCCKTKHVNMGHNKLLSQSTSVVVFPMRLAEPDLTFPQATTAGLFPPLSCEPSLHVLNGLSPTFV